MINPLLLPEIREMLASGDREALAEVLADMHPASVAEFSEGLSVAETWKLLDHLPIDRQAYIFPFYSDPREEELAAGDDRAHFARLLEAMSHDDRGALIRRLDPVLVGELLPLMNAADREDIQKILAYPENTAGGMMTTDFVSISDEMTANDAIAMLREKSPASETIYYLYVLDRGHRMQGIVSLRDLIVAKPDARVSDIMSDKVISVKATADREDVAREMAKYDFLAMPVTDDQNRMVGIVTYDDAHDVMTKEATEDALHMGGVGGMTENYLDGKFSTIWRQRAMWLSLLFFAELGTFSALAHFQDQLERIVVLGMFIPLCISTGGNSGSQAATLVTRALALGQVRLKDWFRVLRHEFAMGIALGVTLMLIAVIRVYFTPADVLNPEERVVVHLEVTWQWMALAVSQAVLLICLWGTLVGSMLPLIFKRIGVDPAYASSPFVATFVDVTGIIIFFSLSKVYLF